MELAVKLLCVAPLPTWERPFSSPISGAAASTTPLRNWPAIGGTGPSRLAEGPVLAVCQRHRMTITSNSLPARELDIASVSWRVNLRLGKRRST